MFRFFSYIHSDFVSDQNSRSANSLEVRSRIDSVILGEHTDVPSSQMSTKQSHDPLPYLHVSILTADSCL